MNFFGVGPIRLKVAESVCEVLSGLHAAVDHRMPRLAIDVLYEPLLSATKRAVC